MIGTGSTLNDRFALEKELGEGGMGTVYRATDRLLGRRVAIKFLKDSGTREQVELIRLEAQILARLVHDRVVRLYDLGESEGNHFLVMEEVDGPSFGKRWRDLALSDRLRICGQVAEALHYAHLQGVIHRDVKPGNVLLTANDQAKLSDFGLSLVISDREAHSGTIRGTPRYMSPEQAQGRPLDHRTDLYSTGVMLYECATGRVPFEGDGMSVLAQHVYDEPPAPRLRNPEISSMLESLILSLLEKDPTRRPASGNALALKLTEEADRARRIERAMTGSRRSDPQLPVAPPPMTTVSVVKPKAGPAPADGNGREEPGAFPPTATQAPSARSRGSDAAGPTNGPIERSGTRPAAASGAWGHPIAREMLARMLDTPIILSPEERYHCGYYLGFLLGGSRRRGIFLRRPLDARNSDRARLLLAMTWLSVVEPTEEAIERAGALLDERPDVRAALSPLVVIKYLRSRDTPAKLKRFRQVRSRLKEGSAHAQEAMLDGNGVLNPGMMPRTLADLAEIAPHRRALDAHRVSLWNRASEVWRQEDDFRQSVLRYVMRSDDADAVSADLWPEVVYALIERAHWQRTFRPRHEALWDYVVGKLLHLPVPGVRLDRMMMIAVPPEVAAQLDEDLSTILDEPQIDEDEASPSESTATAERRPLYVGATIPRDEPPSDDAPRVRELVRLSPAEPFLFTQDGLRDLWEMGMEAQNNGARPGSLPRTVPVGPYRLAVVPTARGKSAIRAVLQILQLGKEIEIITPLLDRGSGPRTMIAVWVYLDGSLAVVHINFQSQQRYIFWHAPNAHQFNFTYIEELKVSLSASCLEVPDRLGDILSKA